MSKTFLNAADAVVSQNGEKVYVVNQATSGTTANVNLVGLRDVDGNLLIPALPPPGYQLQSNLSLVLQADQDFFYSFTAATGNTINTAKSVKVLAGQQEWVSPKSSRQYLNVIQATAGGTVQIFVIRYG